METNNYFLWWTLGRK